MNSVMRNAVRYAVHIQNGKNVDWETGEVSDPPSSNPS